VVLIGVFLLMYEAFAGDRDRRFIGWAAILGLGVVLVASFFAAPGVSGQAGFGFYVADATALYFKRLLLAATMAVIVIGLEYRDVARRFIFGGTGDAGFGEFLALPVLTCAGLMWMASASDFTMIFVALELVTISFYVLVSYMRRSVASLEAGAKYLILGALSTGFLVYGITWIYGVTGEFDLGRIAERLPSLEPAKLPLLFGVVLVLIALGFKVAATPFQFWVPDVYQGAPTPVTAYLSVGSKAAGFVVLVRVLETFSSVGYLREKLVPLIGVLAVLTLLYGNLAALPQENFKRLLAYSSIGHAGYLLMALAAMGGSLSGLAVGVYLGGYLLMTMVAFLAVAVVNRACGGDDLAHFNGLARRSPYVAGCLTVAMASLAGVPLTVGFAGKFLAFWAAIQQHLFGVVAVAAVTAVAGFYYYLKVVRAMYWNEAADGEAIRLEPLTRWGLGILTLGVLVLGVYPWPLIAMVR
jgi:NADH-quinone oxidoreductase subunit N